MDVLNKKNYNSNFRNLTIPNPIEFTYPEKILQFGTGAFLRGFVDYFIDHANKKGVFKGRIVTISSTDSGRDDILKNQDYLYTLLVEGFENGNASQKYTQIASISRTLSATSDWEEVLRCAENPEIEIIISNTTEAGIVYKEEIIGNKLPSSFPAKLLSFLLYRFNYWKGRTDKGLVILPCELINNNGDVLKSIVLKLCSFNKLGKDFIEWIESSISFCNTLVDRIVTGSPDIDKIQEIQSKLGYIDKMLTVCEPYKLWAIEGNDFVQSKLTFALAEDSIVFSNNIESYREQKLRILNGTHSIIVGLGYINDCNTIIECINHKEMNDFIKNIIFYEIIPTIENNKAELRKYANSILYRFENPFLKHSLLNISLEYTTKMEMRNIETIIRFYEKFNTPPILFCKGFAAYLFFMKAAIIKNEMYFGVRKNEKYHINDTYASYFYTIWQKTSPSNQESIKDLVLEVCKNASIWKRDLSLLPGFVSQVSVELYGLITKNNN